MILSNSEAGRVGEDLLNALIEQFNLPLKQSENPNDNKKDYKFFDKKLELKTIVPFNYCNVWGPPEIAFPINEDQLVKCSNANYLLFLVRSGPGRNKIEGYLAPKLGERYFAKFVTNKGRVTYPIQKAKCKKVFEIKDPYWVNKLRADK